MFLPSASGSVASAARNASEFEQLAQEHLLAPRVGQLDADGVAPRDHVGTHASGPQGAGDVVGEPDHARRLDAACRLELVERDDGAGVHILDLTLDAEVGEHLAQQPRLAAQLRLRQDGPGLGGSRAPQQAERGAPRGHLPAVLALLGRGHVQSGRRALDGGALRLAGGGSEAFGDLVARALRQAIERGIAARARHIFAEVGRLRRVGLDQHRSPLEVQHRRLAYGIGCRARRHRGSVRRHPVVELSAPAGHGPEIGLRIGLANQPQLLPCQAEAAHQHHQPGSEVEQPRRGGGAIGIDVGEQARQQTEAEIAEHTAVSVMQRPRRGRRQRRERAGEEENGQRRQHELAAQSGRLLAGEELQGPEQRRQQNEHAGQAQHLDEHVGENGTGGPEQIAGSAAGGTREARVRGRPRKQARAQCRAGDEHEEAQHFPQPPLEPMPDGGRQKGGRVIGPIRHTPKRAGYAVNATIRPSASLTVATSCTSAMRTKFRPGFTPCRSSWAR